MAPKKNQVKRNERERKRVHQVNDGFDRLRTHLRPASANKKLSKADTLREAVKYINHLQSILDSNNSAGFPFPQSMLPIKDEFDAYFPNHSHHQFPHQANHDFMAGTVPSAGSSGNIPAVSQYTPPSSNCSTSYSPPQMYYSPQGAVAVPYHNGMHHSP